MEDEQRSAWNDHSGWTARPTSSEGYSGSKANGFPANPPGLHSSKAASPSSHCHRGKQEVATPPIRPSSGLGVGSKSCPAESQRLAPVPKRLLGSKAGAIAAVAKDVPLSDAKMSFDTIRSAPSKASALAQQNSQTSSDSMRAAASKASALAEQSSQMSSGPVRAAASKAAALAQQSSQTSSDPVRAAPSKAPALAKQTSQMSSDTVRASPSKASALLQQSSQMGSDPVRDVSSKASPLARESPQRSSDPVRAAPSKASVLAQQSSQGESWHTSEGRNADGEAEDFRADHQGERWGGEWSDSRGWDQVNKADAAGEGGHWQGLCGDRDAGDKGKGKGVDMNEKFGGSLGSAPPHSKSSSGASTGSVDRSVSFAALGASKAKSVSSHKASGDVVSFAAPKGPPVMSAMSEKLGPPSSKSSGMRVPPPGAEEQAQENGLVMSKAPAMSKSQAKPGPAWPAASSLPAQDHQGRPNGAGTLQRSVDGYAGSDAVAGWQSWGDSTDASQGEEGDVQAKRRRVAKWEENSLNALSRPGLPSPDAGGMTKASPPVKPPILEVVYPEGKDAEWQIPWGKVFQKFKAGDMDARAGEFAEALVELRAQEAACDVEIETLADSCNQLLMTGYREALLAHLKALIKEISVGLPEEVIEACRRAADDPQPQNPSVQSKAGQLPQAPQAPHGKAAGMQSAIGSWAMQPKSSPAGFNTMSSGSTHQRLSGHSDMQMAPVVQSSMVMPGAKSAMPQPGAFSGMPVQVPPKAMQGVQQFW